MDNLTTYTSPHTGRVYTVVAEAQTRAAWDENGVCYDRQYTQYNFFLDGNPVTFTFDLDEKRLSDTFGELEGVYAAWTTSARD